MKHTTLRCLRDLLPYAESAKALLFDWDGCLALGDDLMPGARALLRKVADRTAIVSNQSAIEATEIAGVLERAGVAIDPARILMAGERVIDHVAGEMAGAKVTLIAAPALRARAQRQGLELVEQNAEIVLVLRDPTVTWDVIARAAEAVRRGAVLISSNPDAAHPSRGGHLVPETGTIAQAVAFCAGTHVAYTYGKPQPHLFRLALWVLGAHPSSSIMVGDNPDTDGAGATALGIEFFRLDTAMSSQGGASQFCPRH